MDPASHLASLEADSATFAELAPAHLDRAVPGCPGWDVARLAGHLGAVYSWAAGAVGSGGARPERERATPPDGHDELIGWFVSQRQAVLAALRAQDPGAPAWVFLPSSPQTVAWWLRRQAMETAIHLYDLQSAAGMAPSISAQLAADGIDELLTEMVPGRLARNPVSSLSGSFHIHCTDSPRDAGTPGEWMLEFASGGVEVRREHAKGDTAARGPAAGLYLWLWNRMDPQTAGIEVLGDTSLVDAWRQVNL
ncbi:MAG: maleylpyruvate isomerase N-terminal domain-containing protein [Acidimicrobiales bacterium]|nr:maleylpyruvate isomerase N-terminal domain-containing protein [Acidimicrobiales bacterium]